MVVVSCSEHHICYTFMWPFPKVLRLKSSILGDCIRPLVMKRLARRKCSPGEPELGQ